MSKLGNVAKIEFRKQPSIVSPNALDQKAFRGMLRDIVEVTQYIPATLVDKVGEEIAKGTKAAFEPGRDRRPVAGQFTDEKAVAAALALPVEEVSRAYFAYYKAMLVAMDNLLRDPGFYVTRTAVKKYIKRERSFQTLKDGKPITREFKYESRETYSYRKNVSLKIDELIGRTFTSDIELKGQWVGLAESTIEKKQDLGYKPTFWKHTGEASQEFHSAVTARLSRLQPYNFKGALVRKYIDYASSESAKQRVGGRRKFVRTAKFEIAVGVPYWNQKLDTITTLPFATGDMSGSTLTGTGLKPGQRKLRGINRILAAEASRPLLRQLASKAGQALQKHLSGRASGVSQGRSPLALSFAQAQREAVEQRIFDRLVEAVEKKVRELAAKEAKAAKPLKPKKQPKRLTDEQRAANRAARAASDQRAKSSRAKNSGTKDTPVQGSERVARNARRRAKLQADSNKQPKNTRAKPNIGRPTKAAKPQLKFRPVDLSQVLSPFEFRMVKSKFRK